MADQIEVTEEDVRQAAALESALPETALAAIDLCAYWQKVKPYWPWIIKLVKKIPKVGGTIAKALERIGAFLDDHCK